MVNYYLDTSALLKRYVNEIGSQWVKGQIDHASLLISSRLLIVEVTSALNRRVREETLSPTEYRRIRSIFRDDCRTSYQIITLADAVFGVACELLERYPLRSYDAVHLATALIAHRSLRARNLPGIVFVSADDRLNAAASAEGLTIDNPLDHP